MRIIVGGNNWLACEVVRWLIERDESIVGLVPEGRDLVDSPQDWEAPFEPLASHFASERGIPIWVGNINQHQQQLNELSPDLIVMCRSRALVKPHILNLPTVGITNIHFGKLPAYGGCHTIQWALLNGEPTVGVTLHFMSERFDDGPIIAQGEIDTTGGRRQLDGADRTMTITGRTAFEIYQSANRIGLQLFQENFQTLKSGTLQTIEQDKFRHSYFRADSIDFTKDRFIDLTTSTDEELQRHVQAFTFPPLQLPVGTIGNAEFPLTLKEDRARPAL